MRKKLQTPNRYDTVGFTAIHHFNLLNNIDTIAFNKVSYAHFYRHQRYAQYQRVNSFCITTIITQF